MTGLARLYGPASACALAGMAWRMGWFGLRELHQFGAVLLVLTVVLLGFLLVVGLFVALAGLFMWLLWQLCRLTVAVVITLTPRPSRSAPGQP